MTTDAEVRLLDHEHRGLLIGLLCLVTVVALEALAVSTVMPIVEADLGGLRWYGWVFSGFYLGTLVGVVVGGRTADYVRPVVPIVAGVAVFLAGLVLGGLAPTMWWLVVGRVLQGLGAGVVPAIVYVCVGRGFPPVLRPKVFAAMSTAWILPSLVSPLAASVIAERFGWRWVFLGLIPATIVVAAFAVPAVAKVPSAPPADGTAPRATPLTWVLAVAVGAGLLLGGLGAEQPLLGVLVAAVGLVVLLPAYRRLTPDGTLRAAPGLPAAILIRGVLTFAFFSGDAFISLAMTSVRDTSTRTAGLAITAAAFAWTAGSWTQARKMPTWGPARLVGTGGAMVAVASTVMALALFGWVPLWLWFVGSAINGGGIGLAYSPLSVVTLGEAEPSRIGAATASLQMSDILGVAMGTGVAGVIVALGDRWEQSQTTTLQAVFALAAVVAVVVALLAPRLPKVAPIHVVD